MRIDIQCPNENLPEWKTLAKAVGEDAAHLVFQRMNAKKGEGEMYDIPTPEQAKDLLQKARRDAMIAKYSKQAAPTTVAQPPPAEPYKPASLPVANARDGLRRAFNPAVYVPALIGIVLLGVALGEMPYGYYTFLRLVLCPVFAWLAFRSAVAGGKILPWILGVAALLYNPIIRVHFQREAWEVINVISIILLVVSAAVSKKEA